MLALAGPFAPFVVFLLAAAESAAFVGVVVPGELAVILGGVAAGSGSVPLGWMIAAAVSGAVVGDSIGYSLGSRMGSRLLDKPRLAKVATRLDSAAAMINERGWWALVVARFASILRAVVPFAAGMSKMPYRRFLLGNAVGGVAWGTTFTLVGYLAGANYPRVEHWFRTGGLAVFALIAILGGIVWSTRWIEGHQLLVIEKLNRLGKLPMLRNVVALIRFTNRPAVTIGFAATGIVVALWVFAGLLQDVIGIEEFFFSDIAVIDYLSVHRSPLLTHVAAGANSVIVSRWLFASAGAVALGFVTRRRFDAGSAIAMAVGGQWLIVEVIQQLVDRAPPAVIAIAPRDGYGFPSAPVAAVTALALVVAWPWFPSTWRTTVLRFGGATAVAVVAGAARLLLLVDYPSDVIAGAMVAAAWTLLVCAVIDTRRAGPSSVTQEPSTQSPV